MAIDMHHRDLDEIRHCERSMHTARSHDEYAYYRARLRELEHRAMRGSFYEPPRLGPSMPPLPSAPSAVTPLSFLSNADKKLLLIGEMA